MEKSKSEREKMTNGEPFFTNDPQLMEDKKNARILCKQFNDSPEEESIRSNLLRELLGECRSKHLSPFVAPLLT